MKHLLLTTIAAVVLVGCGESQQSVPSPESKPEPPTAKAPVISIHDAAKDGNIEAVKQHLAAGADVNAKSSSLGHTPLQHAAFGGHKETVELLIANGADVNAKNVVGQTPLIIAAFWGHKEIVELLIAKGADVNAKDDDGKTPLNWAIDFKKTKIVDLLRKHGGKTGAGMLLDAVNDGDIEAVKQYLDAGGDVDAKGLGGYTPLHFAAGGGHKEVAELLIAKGADLGAKDNRWRKTPLHYAAYSGHKEVAELLIAKGANVNARDAGGGTPLDLADNKVTADLLRKHGGKTGEEIADEMAKRSIHVAARVGDIDWVIKHLEAVTNVDAKEGGGYTPLLHAAITGHKEIVELLIAKGADVNAKDDDGYTPLLHAALNLDAGIFELLIDNGADVNAKADNGETSLDRAIGLRLTETANLLRKHGGKTGEELKGGAPVAEASQPEPPIAKAPDIPIHTAARDGNTLAVKQHLDAGTDVNTKTAFLGSVPLHYAAHSGYTETAEQLIVSGANVNVMDAGDTTPLDWAIQKKRTETAALLRKHGGKTGEELKAEAK